MYHLEFKSYQITTCAFEMTKSLSIHSISGMTKHYANTPMQYTAIFHGCKNVNFQMKEYNIFLIFAQNIDCGYTLDPPH